MPPEAFYDKDASDDGEPCPSSTVDSKDVSEGGSSSELQGAPGPHGTNAIAASHMPRVSWDSVAVLADTVRARPMAAVRHVFSEGFLLLKLAVKLWSYLGIGEQTGLGEGVPA